MEAMKNDGGDRANRSVIVNVYEAINTFCIGGVVL